MEFFELYSKEKANCFCLIKLLFIKVRCLINVNEICGLLRNGWKKTQNGQHMAGSH